MPTIRLITRLETVYLNLPGNTINGAPEPAQDYYQFRARTRSIVVSRLS